MTNNPSLSPSPSSLPLPGVGEDDGETRKRNRTLDRCISVIPASLNEDVNDYRNPDHRNLNHNTTTTAGPTAVGSQAPTTAQHQHHVLPRVPEPIRSHTIITPTPTLLALPDPNTPMVMFPPSSAAAEQLARIHPALPPQPTLTTTLPHLNLLGLPTTSFLVSLLK
ncbi:hypothetical protein K435DRAFT_852530 [Dendrothele bispora CBS 962.96]|uniref:Uncharacterized protein n=1 Tax=Dendrothele bispora (strain CBS 962.96) TaxID=1314807 RepID=A0A4S8MJ86_DENBC|nr:hypothetical protein K435DRAFT_852530 [Dendrothele bispora CBS 962.96]